MNRTHLTEVQIEAVAEYAASVDDLVLEQYCDTLLLHPEDEIAHQVVIEAIEQDGLQDRINGDNLRKRYDD